MTASSTSVAALAAMFADLRKHTEARVAAMPKARARRRTYTDYLCPMCGERLACKEPNVYNAPAVDTRDGSITDWGPIWLLWSCVNHCRSDEQSDASSEQEQGR